MDGLGFGWPGSADARYERRVDAKSLDLFREGSRLYSSLPEYANGARYPVDLYLLRDIRMGAQSSSTSSERTRPPARCGWRGAELLAAADRECARADSRGRAIATRIGCRTMSALDGERGCHGKPWFRMARFSRRTIRPPSGFRIPRPIPGRPRALPQPPGVRERRPVSGRPAIPTGHPHRCPTGIRVRGDAERARCSLARWGGAPHRPCSPWPTVRLRGGVVELDFSRGCRGPDRRRRGIPGDCGAAGCRNCGRRRRSIGGFLFRPRRNGGD